LRLRWDQYELGDSFAYVPVASDAAAIELILTGGRSLSPNSPVVCEEIDSIQAKK
jgi:hypothetical protein